ncbi:MAG: S8 family serine peptidase, partial [Ignavibacterium sp.]|nr:S8 family serine peptidase [Ignavibacterium sp.]MDW8375992.1 S8 family serine peptidase [Ignavibacteriales bacterium]
MKRIIILLILIFSARLYSQYVTVTEISQVESLTSEMKSKILSGILIKNIIEKNKSYFEKKISKEEANEIVAIYFKEKPSNNQILEIENLGIECYLNSWTPPLNNHPFGFIVAKLPTYKFINLLTIESVQKLSTLEHQHYPDNNYATNQIGANSVWGQGFTGTGVKVAVLDSGLDSFYEGTDLPNGYQRRDYSNYPTSIDNNCENTVTGHGTHVTGSVLGRGNLSNPHSSNNGNQPFKGSAPNASLVFLKIGNDANASASSAAMIASVHSAVDTFGAKIISMSYGGWYDHHDGSSATEQKFDWAFNQGVISFVSAGNSALSGRHYSGTVAANSSTGFIQFTVPSSQKPTFNLVYFDGAANSGLYMQYFNSSFVQITQIDEYPTTESSRGTESRYYQSQNNFTAGTFYLKVFNPSGQNLKFHIYEVFNAGITFASPDQFYTIGQPSSADEVIAVGAYVSRKQWWDYLNNGPYSYSGQNNQYQIANFSSRGPRADEVIKPNITAPGSAIISLRDTDVLTSPNSFWIDNDGNTGGSANYYIMQGTSMAAPIAAGTAALFYHKFPSATPTQLRNALQHYASKSITENYPNNIWGYGKLDIFSATNSVPTIDGYMSESNYSGIGYFTSGRNGFGIDNDLKTLRYFTDGTDIYIGITGELTSNDNLLLLFNFSSYNGRGSNTLGNGVTDAGVFKHIGGAKMDFDIDFALAFNEGNSSTNFYIDACRYGSSTPVLATGYIGNIANQLGGSAEFNLGSIFGGSGNIKIAYRNNFASDSLSGIEMKIPIAAFAGVDNTQQIQLFAIILNSSGFFSNECIPGDPGDSNPGNNPNFSLMSGGPFHTGQYPLPIELTDFFVKRNGNLVQLNWVTATEVNSFLFEIEKMVGKDWTKIGQVYASGNSNSPKYYSFVDKSLNNGLIFYRLKMIDIDGSFTYSNISELNIDLPYKFTLEQNYPNP